MIKEIIYYKKKAFTKAVKQTDSRYFKIGFYGKDGTCLISAFGKGKLTTEDALIKKAKTFGIRIKQNNKKNRYDTRRKSLLLKGTEKID